MYPNIYFLQLVAKKQCGITKDTDSFELVFAQMIKWIKHGSEGEQFSKSGKSAKEIFSRYYSVQSSDFKRGQ
jgi:hypothetical protein